MTPEITTLLADAREIYGVFGKAQRALTIVDRVLALQPDNVEALNLKAAILYDLDRDDESRACSLHALAGEPCSVEALHGLAALANDARQFTEALQWLARGFACIATDPYPEFRENADYRQRVVAQLYCEKAHALWYLGQREAAESLLIEEGTNACPLEIETLEDELEWLKHHPMPE